MRARINIEGNPKQLVHSNLKRKYKTSSAYCVRLSKASYLEKQ